MSVRPAWATWGPIPNSKQVVFSGNNVDFTTKCDLLLPSNWFHISLIKIRKSFLKVTHLQNSWFKNFSVWTMENPRHSVCSAGFPAQPTSGFCLSPYCPIPQTWLHMDFLTARAMRSKYLENPINENIHDGAPSSIMCNIRTWNRSRIISTMPLCQVFAYSGEIRISIEC